MFKLKQITVVVLFLNVAFFVVLYISYNRHITSQRSMIVNQNAKTLMVTDDINQYKLDQKSSVDGDNLIIDYDSLVYDNPLTSHYNYTTNEKNNQSQIDSKDQRAKEEKTVQDNTFKLTQDLNNLKQQIELMNLFRLLDAYQTPDKSYFNEYPGARPHYNKQYMGIKQNSNYCDIVDMYNLAHPENVFEKMNFIGDYIPTSLVKKHVFPALGQDVMPECHVGVTKGSYEMNTTATAFFTKSTIMHHFFKIGSHFKCVSQTYGHIPGNGILTRKDMNVGMVNNYAKKYENKPQCFNKNMYFPYAYRLNNKTECQQFFEELNTQEYKQLRASEPITFILKIGWGAHRGQGLFMFDEKKEKETKKKYLDGQACGTIDKPLLAQKYISNPLLLDLNNKFDFRMYMLISSVNPFVVYYHDGFLRVSLGIYDKNSKEKGVHFTNTHLSKEAFAKASNGDTIHGMNEDELRDYQMWTMEDLQDYLYEIGKIKNKNWLDEYLRPKFKEAFIHTVRMAQGDFKKLSGSFEMFGLDFLLDENLNLWFVECNASPQLIGTNDYKTQFLTKMLKDMFEIQYAYLRSRWTRIHKFMQKFHEFVSENKKLGDLEPWRAEFASINLEKLEPEFTISEDNSWHKIMDKNIPGKGAYLGLFNEECLDEDEM